MAPGRSDRDVDVALIGLLDQGQAGNALENAIAFTSRLIEAGVDASVGSVGDAYDNPLAESQIGLFKTELTRPYGPWRDVDHVELKTMRRGPLVPTTTA